MQRDYILRLIEQLGQALIGLRDRILGRESSPGEIQAELDDVARRGGVNLELARQVTPETLMTLVAPGGEIEPGQTWLLAELLYLDGLEARNEERPTDATESWHRAMLLYELLVPRGMYLVGFPEASERLNELRELLNDAE